MTQSGEAIIIDSTVIVQYLGGPLDAARAWADLNPEERRRRAVVAAQHLDTAALWSLTEAHTLLYGHAGGSLSPRTARSYREGVTCFVRHAEHAGVSLIRPERDAGPVYARTLEGQGLAPSSVRVHLAAARALYKALRWAEVTALDPFSDTTAAKDRTAAWDKRQPYLEEEVQSLLDASGLRDRTLILLCAHGGLRIMEALALTWADIQGDALMVRRGKGGKARRVTCSRTLLAALEAWCEVDGTPDGLIIGASQTAARERLWALCKKLGVQYRGWHAFRHYAGTRLAAHTSLENAARHLGHASIETTRVYAKWADRSLKDELARW